VVDAVRCAVEIQRELKAKNAELPGRRKMEFRIGINLGDVVVEGERLYGDGVNIAARLESLADPGSICIAGTVYDHVETKLALRYEYVGEQTVKNIAKPVRVYRVRLDEAAMPGKPTALSQLASLFVIARNSAFTYKGKAVKVQEIGRELGVRYVLEGSVRKTHDQVRITAQLIDAATESHLWAQRYDRPLKDIFALQDEIVQKIVTTLKLQFTLREQGDLVRKTTDNLEAYDAYLRGLEAYNRYTKEALTQARQLFEQAIALDPQYAEAYARLSRTLTWESMRPWGQYPQELERALVLAQQAVALDDSLPGAHEALAFAYTYKKQYEQAITVAKRAIALAPNNAEGYAELAHTLLFAGRPEEVIGLIEKAMRLNPRHPFHYLSFLGMAHVLAKRYEEALAALQSATLRDPNHPPAHLHLLVSYSELGRDEEARAELAEIRRINPNVSLEFYRRVMVFKDPASLERYLAALHKAGLK
jgi:adenylate cyclase